MHALGLIFLGAVTLLGMLWLRSKPAPQRRTALLKLVVTLLVLGVLYLAVTGRLHWLGALVAVLFPFARRLLPLLRFLPLLGGLFKQARQGPANHRSNGNQSSIETRLLNMTLDHDSGVMHGTILQGPLRGMELGALSEQQFLDLLAYCRQHDEESGRVLESYLDKRFGDSWRADDQEGTAYNGDSQPNHTGALSDKDAWEVLGLTPGASEQDIIQAHRRLMQKVHPDRGGSHYLAARINEAKDRLLK